ncbi:MAG: hypothetical protein LBB43_06125 [Spirochaetaceae bacterium]|jgi:hypothetical protein|nr:hypothetical protein [Spirochaetaceae bacterium]
MNTIPTTFNDSVPSYTAVGGTSRAAFSGLSAILLSRGGRYPRRTLFQELEKIGFDYIISIEGSRERYDVDELSERFPQVSFIFLKQAITTGEQINLAVGELSSPLFFVLWDDLRILHSGGALRMAERLLLNTGVYRRLCTVPLIQNSHFETLPTISIPLAYKSTVKRVLLVPTKEGEMSLYPFDGVGIYDRTRFIGLGGFDSTIKNTQWQLMDFGFRAHLWGEHINSTHLIRLSYDGDIPTDDSTADYNYRRFYLKNVAPLFHGDSAIVPMRRFISYWWRSGKGLGSAWTEFSQGRRWVKTNRYRFKSDVRAIIELWEDVSERPELEALEQMQLSDRPSSSDIEEEPPPAPIVRSGT